MLSCSVRFSAPSFWMGGGLESCCVGCVYGADSVSPFFHLFAWINSTPNRLIFSKSVKKIQDYLKWDENGHFT